MVKVLPSEAFLDFRDFRTVKRRTKFNVLGLTLNIQGWLDKDSIWEEDFRQGFYMRGGL